MKLLKKAEKLIKRIAERSILHFAKRDNLSFDKDVVKEYGIRNILFIRDDRCGDVIVSEPVFRYLKKSHPEVRSCVLLGKHNASAFSGISPFVNKAFVVQKKFFKILKLIKTLRSEKFDLIIDMKDGKSLNSVLIILFVNPKYSSGLESGGLKIFNFAVPRIDRMRYNIYERTGNLLRLFGYNPEIIDLRPHFALGKLSAQYYFEKLKRDGNKICSINLSGSNRSKYWGTNNYIAFIALLNSAFPSIKILLLYTSDYEAEADTIAMKTSAVKSEQFPTFNDFATCIAASDILLTPDTSAVHLASAFGVRCIALYVQDIEDKTKVAPWFPFGVEYRAFGNKTGQIESILPKEVFDKSEDLFSSI